MTKQTIEDKKSKDLELHFDISIALIVGQLVRIAEKQYRDKGDLEKVADLESKFYWLVAG